MEKIYKSGSILSLSLIYLIYDFKTSGWSYTVHIMTFVIPTNPMLNMSFIFIKLLENIFLNIPEQCQKLVKSAQIFTAPNIPYITPYDFPTLSNPFR